MLLSEQERFREELRALAEKYGRNQSALLPMLQEVKSRYRQISDYAMQSIADLLGLHPVEVYGVVSFYSFLGDRPQGRFVIRLCRTLSCDMAHKDRVARQLENDLGIQFGQTTPDGVFTLEWANCLGLCDQGPALLVNDRAYTQVAPEHVHDILSECRHAFGANTLQKKEGLHAS